MTRTRVRAAQRRLSRLAAARVGDSADEIARGVGLVAREIAAVVKPGGLWLAAPAQYVAEQVAVRLVAHRGLPESDREDVSLYVLAALNEFLAALVGSFDEDHFRAWTAAQNAAESG